MAAMCEWGTLDEDIGGIYGIILGLQKVQKLASNSFIFAWKCQRYLKIGQNDTFNPLFYSPEYQGEMSNNSSSACTAAVTPTGLTPWWVIQWLRRQCGFPWDLSLHLCSDSGSLASRTFPLFPSESRDPPKSNVLVIVWGSSWQVPCKVDCSVCLIKDIINKRYHFIRPTTQLV